MCHCHCQLSKSSVGGCAHCSAALHCTGHWAELPYMRALDSDAANWWKSSEQVLSLDYLSP